MSNFIETLTNGFTYSGTTFHMLINYGLIVLTLLPLILLSKTEKIKPWHFAFIFSFLFQIFLWFFPGAEGVSVVWCAMAGFGLMHLLKNRLAITMAKYQLVGISLFPALIGNVYYAVTFPLITTIAHVCAVLMGMGLYFLGWRMEN